MWVFKEQQAAMWLEGETGPEGPWRGLGFHPKSGERSYRGSCPNPSGLLGGDTSGTPFLLPSSLGAVATPTLWLPVIASSWPLADTFLHLEARSALHRPAAFPSSAGKPGSSLPPDGTWRP